MTRQITRQRLRTALLACVTGFALMGSTSAFAQDAAPAPGAQVDSRALLELMVQKGLVTREEADKLIAQATVAPPQQAAIPAGGVQGDTQTIPYIPQTVRNQLKEELRTELANQAASEGWARPGEVAEWTKRITLFGDIRVRGEGVLMGDGNFDRSFPNFQAINANGGYDINPNSNPLGSAPFLNATEDRFRPRIRARLGLRARVDDWITAEVRAATGDERAPISTNQTLGANGEFGKYAIWLDRANIQLTPLPGLRIDLGRAENPFWTGELLFDEDINFDGVSLRYAGEVTDGLKLFGTAGAFPIFNTALNFGSNEAGAFSSHDKYLFAGQLGGEYAFGDTARLKLAAGYFFFDKVQGQASSPCPYYQDVCDTDATVPQFIQFGNTLFPVRTHDFSLAPDPDLAPDVQLFGLASKYEVLNVRGQLDLDMFKPVGVRLEGDFVKNLGFKRSLVSARAVNNLGPDVEVPNPNDDPDDPNDNTIIVPGPWDGGDIGWSVNLTVGKPDLLAPGDWRVSLGYRRVESDAVLDAFADSDFHLGGTNAKGWILGGGYAIGKSTAIGARWLSSDSITGVPYSNDVIQLDLTTRF